ncbi:MAG: hypothetical protein HYW48_03800 [Deltaproteobacteria bacterium]|nr:hypothetical protein [Deltaproteobacteria bacterium]
MRKLFAGLLLTAFTVPVLADHGDDRGDRDDRYGRVMCVAKRGFGGYHGRYVGVGRSRHEAAREALMKCNHGDRDGWNFDHRRPGRGRCYIDHCRRVGGDHHGPFPFPFPFSE